MQRTLICLLWLCLVIGTMASGHAQIPAQPPSAPNLFVVSIGISQYKDPRYDTRYGVKDAKDFTLMLAQRAAGLFSHVNSLQLSDKEATRDHIWDRLNGFIGKVRPEDTFVFYFNGHALTKDNELYLMTSEMANVENIETDGFAASLLKTLCAKMQARNQVIILDCVDAYKAFQTFETQAAEQREAVRNLTKKNQYFLVTAGQNELSFEDERFGNGLATSVLLQGLDGAAANGPAFDTITAGGLCRYVINQVSERTHDQQRPILLHYGSDFPLAIPPKPKPVPQHDPSSSAGQSSYTPPLEILSAYEDTPIYSACVSRKLQADTSRGTSPVPSAREEQEWLTRTDYALFIATDKYDHYDKLDNPILDTQAISGELKARFSFKQIQELSNPNLDDILTALAGYQNKTYNKYDQLLIFFAGHGFFNTFHRDGYIVSANSLPAQPLRNDSCLSQSDLRNIVSNIPCKHILLVLDTCFGGTIDRRLASLEERLYLCAAPPDSQKIRRFLESPSHLFLTSGGKEYVPDGRPGHHSPFANQFLKTLQKCADGDFLTFEEVRGAMKRVDPMPHWGEWDDNGPNNDFIFETVPHM